MSIYLRKVRMRNFRTFGQLDFDVAGAPGLVIVTGPNGLGKSSFFDGIEWGLTGQVMHFEKFLGRGNTEADYLTREGAAPFSHTVDLSFTEGAPVVRAGGASGPTGTTDEALKALLVSPSWGQKIDSLSTYLALTHFLGQGSQQRFMSRDEKDQWKALRMPSGVERLEQVRNRLRGQSAILAFNRKVEAAHVEVNQSADCLARWDALVERLRRLEDAADAAGALPREQIAVHTELLRDRLLFLSTIVTRTKSLDLTKDMADLRANIVEVDKKLESEGSRLMGLARLLDQHAELMGRESALRVSLAALGSQKSASEAKLAVHRGAAERLDLEHSQLASQVGRLRERATLLAGAQADLHALAAAAQQKTALERSIEALERSVAELREALAELNVQVHSLQIGRDALAAAQERHSTALALVVQASQIAPLEANLAAAQSRLERADQNSPELTDAEHAELVSDAAHRVDTLRSELVQRRERASTISAALTTLSAHLEAHDTQCPLCQSHFAIGELRRVAQFSAQDADRELPKAQALLQEAEQESQRAKERRAATARAVSERLAALASLREAQTALTTLRTGLLARLDLDDPDADLTAMAAAGLVDREKHLDLVMRELAAQEGRALETQQRRNEARERLEAAEASLLVARQRLSTTIADAGATERRFQVRGGEEGLKAENVPSLLAAAQAQIDEVDAAVSAAVEAYTMASETCRSSNSEFVQVASELGKQEQLLSQTVVQISDLTQTWVLGGLPAPLSRANFERTVTELQGRRAESAAIAAALQRLVAALELTAGREELANVRAMVAKECGQDSIDTHRATLKASWAHAQSEETRIEAARAAIKALAARFQEAADSFSEQVLHPLNELIGAFNDALLTSPGTSVFFNANYFANRTEFSARLRRKQIGAPPVDRPINPQLILSEGQLAANGFSILCSASASYPWSQWQALLLDDPLQHNDVIHAAAFTDMMRNLVEVERYQVLMSSHDRAETEFVERKFTAAGIPCTIVQLIAESPEGVDYEVRHNEAAQMLLSESSLRQVG